MKSKSEDISWLIFGLLVSRFEGLKFLEMTGRASKSTGLLICGDRPSAEGFLFSISRNQKSAKNCVDLKSGRKDIDLKSKDAALQGKPNDHAMVRNGEIAH
jgi:hypothetical protein